MLRLKLLATPLIASAMLAGASAMSAQAGNAGESLGDCYNHVLSSCYPIGNQTQYEHCYQGGMNACDQQHSASMSQIPGTTLKAMRASADRKAKRFQSRKIRSLR